MARLRGAGVEHLGDVRVIHERQCLTFGLEPRDHLSRVHPRLDDLECDPAADGLFLLGHVDEAESPLADLLEQFVGTDQRPRFLASGQHSCFAPIVRLTAADLSQRLMGVQQLLNPRPQLGVPAAALVQERGPSLGSRLQGCKKQRFGLFFVGRHGRPHTCVWPL
jgi:hypothetical protein